jgi:Shedu protein SduA, C-terminal
LPSGFVKDFNYGLGLIKELQPLISTLEGFGVEQLIIQNTKLEKAAIDTTNKTCVLSYAQFETIRKGLGKVVSNARTASLKVRKAVANNTLAFFLDNEDYPQKPLKIQDTAISRLVAKDIENVAIDLSKSDQSLTISIIEKNTKKIAKDQPAKLLKLREDIELVTLEQMIEKYDQMLKKRLSEGNWQAFFNENPFILSMVFGCPILMVQDQASVGGRKLSGSGDKITDFLAKNSMTNNTAIIEIKTPQELLVGKEYRENVYSPSVALSGSLNQALDQKYKLQKNIASIKEASRIYDIETYAVHCALVIGKMPDNLEKQKSFEIFRRNSRDVEIITFDELLEKLKLLHTLLSTNEVE